MPDTSELTWSPAEATQRLETSLQRIETDPAAKAVFNTLLAERGRLQAKASAANASPLAGALISIKALFDIEGVVTTAASTVLAENAAATSDAACIARLDAAGGVFTGITNMSEFAYSGIGLNPHYGTPQNPLYPGSIPGGSTSGGAVSVALGLSDIAIGSDTGGSLRIPAACTGITGFKPTQGSVPMSGGAPLSDTLDSFGPMAKSVAACELAWQVMAGRETVATRARPARLIIPQNFGFTEMDPLVSQGFSALAESLRDNGFDIERRDLSCIEHYHQTPPWHMTSVESRAHYETYFQTSSARFDPRVYTRMKRADELSAIEYRQTLNHRAAFVKAFAHELGDDLLLLPTLPILPPPIEALNEDEAFNRLNLLVLRNPSLANVADGCALALPYRHAGKTLSAMLIGAQAKDTALLACGKAVEQMTTIT